MPVAIIVRLAADSALLKTANALRIVETLAQKVRFVIGRQSPGIFLIDKATQICYFHICESVSQIGSRV